MKPGRSWRKIVAVVFAALVVIVAIAALVRLSSPTVRVKVLDPKVRLRSVNLVRTKRDTLYFGNQTEGRVRDFLKTRLHLSVKQLIRLPMLLMPPPGPGEYPHCFLLIEFSVEEEPFAENALRAEVVDSSGMLVSLLHSSTLHNVNSRFYWQTFDLDASRTNAGDYKIRLIREVLDTNLQQPKRIPVAEVHVYGLSAVVRKPYHVGPNAF